MADESALAAIASVVKSLAADPNNPGHVRAGKHIELPGPKSPEKTLLERELAALALRVRYLETKAHSSGTINFPDTPNETADSLFGHETASSSPRLEPTSAASATPTSGGHNGTTPGDEDDDAPVVPFLEGLREHVDDQSKLLDSQRQELAGVKAQLIQQEQLQEKALAIMEQERVATLERELWKHQKANEAFQKALREIGDILTAVARGDLSKRVRLNTVEMDPEITTFKRTINTMMDQLGDFSMEVSRVAREVGTEGILGGQAQIKGVAGTWKELTDNGKSCYEQTL